MTLTDYPQVLMALCIWREARGESADAQRGVAWVIRNRSRDPERRWPTSTVAVILQPYQFSGFNHADPNSTKFPGASEASWVACCDAADSTLPDPVSGAQYYHSYPDDRPDLWPAWTREFTLVATIGNLKFYRQG